MSTRRNATRAADKLRPVVRRDLRTKIGRINEVLEQIKDHGGFSCFWATDFAARARALDWLQTQGIVQCVSEAFPWVRAITSKPNAEAQRSPASGDTLPSLVGLSGDTR